MRGPGSCLRAVLCRNFLKANPNILECLHSQTVEKATPLWQALLNIRNDFLDQVIFQKSDGYERQLRAKLIAKVRRREYAHRHAKVPAGFNSITRTRSKVQPINSLFLRL